jgi:hypothetical protein
MRIMDVRICSLETPDMRRMRLTLSSSHDLAQYLHISVELCFGCNNLRAYHQLALPHHNPQRALLPRADTSLHVAFFRRSICMPRRAVRPRLTPMSSSEYNQTVVK